MPAARYLDLVAVVAALPVFLLAGLPVAGWGLGAGVWLAQRGLQLLFQAAARRRPTDPRAQVGFTAGGALARGWLAAIAVLVGGLLAGDDVGLSAAVMIMALFSLYFAQRTGQRMAAGPAGRRGE